MATSTCRICLLSFDFTDGQMRPLSDTDGSPQETLCFKLKSIGFLQVGERGEMLCQLCWLCAARVEDAYDLKLQCLKASQATGMEDNSQSSIMDIVASDPVVNEARTLASRTILSLTSRDLPELIDLTCKQVPASSPVSIVSASARDMFACVRNLSSTLQLNVSLLTNAIHFMENTLSLLTVLLSLKEDTPAIKKSAQTIREEADLWKTKSALIADASDFVKTVSGTSFVFGRPPSKSPGKVHKVVNIPSRCAKSSSTPSAQPVSRDKSTSASPLRPVPTPKSKLSPDSSSIFPSVPELQIQSKPDTPAPEISDDLSSTEDGQSVRRSFRSRSVVDHLVYWPSFKKQGNSNSKTSSGKLKSSKKVLSSPVTPNESLDCLLLKRDIGSDSDNSSKAPEEEKWAIVRKRKTSGSQKNEKSAWKLRIKFDSPSAVSNSSSQASCEPENGELVGHDQDEKEDYVVDDEKDEDEVSVKSEAESPIKICPICNKTLCSNRNLQAHIRMHTGASPFQCSYCNKIFSSGWNRAQHERVHTGEKPYVCDVCQEPFRYNVTLRHHKAKVHSVQ